MDLNSKLKTIADIIREKAGISGSLTLDQMAEEIRKLQVEQEGPKTGVFHVKKSETSTLDFHFTVGETWEQFIAGPNNPASGAKFFKSGEYVLYSGMYQYVMKDGTEQKLVDQITENYTYTLK